MVGAPAAICGEAHPPPAAKNIRKHTSPARPISCVPRLVPQKRLKRIRNYVVLDGWLAVGCWAASPQRRLGRRLQENWKEDWKEDWVKKKIGTRRLEDKEDWKRRLENKIG